MHGLLVLVAGILGLATWPSLAAKAGADAQLQDRQVIPPRRVQKLDGAIELGVAPVKGNRAAPLTMIEFSDYQCPFCARHAQQTLPEIDRYYIATGKVSYVFRDLPLPIHPEAPKAAEAAHCAGDQGK